MPTKKLFNVNVMSTQNMVKETLYYLALDIEEVKSYLITMYNLSPYMSWENNYANDFDIQELQYKDLEYKED